MGENDKKKEKVFKPEGQEFDQVSFFASTSIPFRLSSHLEASWSESEIFPPPARKVVKNLKRNRRFLFWKI